MESDNIKILKRTIGLLLTFLIFTGIFTGLLWYFGNPFTRAKVNRLAAEYVSAQYPGQSWQTQKSRYIFTDRQYQVNVYQPERTDYAFTLLFTGEELTQDSYEEDIQNKKSTARRLEGEYSARVQKAADENESLGHLTAAVGLDEDQGDKLTLGMDFAAGDEISYHLFLYGAGEDLTLTGAAEYLRAADALAQKQGYRFSFYGLKLTHDDGTMAIAQVQPEQVRSQNLVRLLEQSLAGDWSNGIYVSVQVPVAVSSEPQQ